MNTKIPLLASGIFSLISVVAFDHVEEFFKTVQVLGAVIVYVDPALFVVADQGNLGAEHAPHTLDEGFELGALCRRLGVLFLPQDFGYLSSETNHSKSPY